MQALEFIPEPFEKLKARFNKSLEIVYSTTVIAKDETQRPGQKRENVFDFEDGVRLIIGREIIQAKEVIHISGSVSEKLYTGKLDESLLNLMVNKFQSLIDFPVEIELVAITEKGIPHFIADCFPFNNLN